jgi:hypothetical protein
MIYVTATTGSILELYRLIMGQLGMKLAGMSRAAMTGQIKHEVLELINGKKVHHHSLSAKPIASIRIQDDLCHSHNGIDP